ncbi:MAG: MFS transporter [Verrucomicrobiota bacterium]
MSDKSVLSIPNIRWFIAFRVFFNARFYYPIFLILFLDMGLTMQHFFVLNVLWAVSIVLLEVPSGAFADTFGRANLIRLAGICMVIEMLILVFVPMGTVWILLLAFGANRVISGLAEALASGADEALAYDTLKNMKREGDWPKVLDLLMRLQSVGFLLAMLVGAAVYDHEFLNACFQTIGLGWTVPEEVAIRLPIALTLITSGVALFAAWSLVEPAPCEHDDDEPHPKNATAAFKLVFDTGRWILHTNIVLILIVAAVCFDSLVRVGLTIGSEYYRLIGLPEAALGIMGAVGGLMGLVIPIIARKLVETRSAVFNFSLLAGLIFVSLLGQSQFWQFWGVIPAIGVGISMSFLGFFMSHYLNRAVTDSRRRATVLSFRSLANNIAYGLAGMVFFGLTAGFGRGEANSDLDAAQNDQVFYQLLQSMPWLFVLLMLFLAWFAKKHHRVSSL